MIRLVTVSCLVVLILELLFVIINILVKKRPQRIAFLRSFKKGKCAIIYVTAIPLYFIGHMFAGQDFFTAFFGAINKILSIVVLKYDTGSIKELMQADSLYKFTIYFCFILVGINALIFTASLTSQNIWSAIQAFKATTIKKDKLFIFGNNPENYSIYNSDKRRNKIIIDDISDKDCEKLYMKRISFISTHDYDYQISKIFRLIRKYDKEYIFIINTGNDEKNITLSRKLIGFIERSSNDLKNRLFLKVKIFVFGDPKYEAIYEDIVSSGFGCIHYINKYQKIAMDFIDKYPLSIFMNEKQIDYETTLVRNDIDINVLFIGFGKTAQQLFLTSVANNQFLTNNGSGAELKKVKYFIFDKVNAENNKNLNHNYYRYKYECSDLNPDDYLPLPDLPADEFYYRLDINDCDFYKQIRNIATKKHNDVNFAVIAFGSDLENIDMAQKLIEKRMEWDIENLVIFVKVRSWHKEQTLLENEGCHFIGNENEVVYNIDKITGDRISQMSQMRSEVYDLEHDIIHASDILIDEEYIKKNHEKSYRNWHINKSQMERESNLYACLSLRSKLNLMGLDYCESNFTDVPGLTYEEYINIYADDDKPNISNYSITANGKPIVHYTLDFPESKRKNLAMLEHQRWNSFMISKGAIPASKDQIEFEKITDNNGEERFSNGKNYQVRRHGNLTTFDGLVEFRRIVATRDKCAEEAKDVIKYDYQLLDDAYWLLVSNGYKIIKKTKID